MEREITAKNLQMALTLEPREEETEEETGKIEEVTGEKQKQQNKKQKKDK